MTRLPTLPRPTPPVSLWVLAGLVWSWVSAVLVAPILPPWPGAFVYAVSSLVCHQLPERSLYWGATQHAVCARCTGIYLGAVLAAAMAAVAGPSRLVQLVRWGRVVLVAGAAPTAATVVAEWSGWSFSHVSRLAAGVPLGWSALAVVSVATAMTTLHYERWPHRLQGPPSVRPRT